MRFSLILFLIILIFLYHAYRTVLTLDIDARDILTENTEAEQLNTSDEQSEHDYSSVACHVNSPDELLNNDKYHITERQKCHHGAHEACELQREGREGQDTANTVLDELSE